MKHTNRREKKKVVTKTSGDVPPCIFSISCYHNTRLDPFLATYSWGCLYCYTVYRSWSHQAIIRACDKEGLAYRCENRSQPLLWLSCLGREFPQCASCAIIVQIEWIVDFAWCVNMTWFPVVICVDNFTCQTRIWLVPVFSHLMPDSNELWEGSNDDTQR